MFTASLVSGLTSQEYNLTGNETNLQIVSITGLAPVPATINTSVTAGIDGVRFNSSRLEPRNIVITLKLVDAQTVRRNLELHFPTKASVTFKYTAGTRAVEIDGYVETFECDLFSENETAQLSILCPDPYFRDQTTRSVTLLPNAGTSINAQSTIPAGVNISAKIQGGAVTNFRITNGPTSEYIQIGYAFAAGDMVNINTTRGQKSVTLTRSGTTTNIFSAVASGSTFFQVWASHATFTYLVNGSQDSTNHQTVVVTINYQDRFSGV